MSSWLCRASWALPHLCCTLWLKAQKYLKFTLYFWAESLQIFKIHLIFSHTGVSGAAAGIAAIPLSLSPFQALISNLPNHRAELLLSHLPSSWKCCIQTRDPFRQLECSIRKEQKSTAGTCRSPRCHDPTGRDLLPPHSLHPPRVLQLFVHIFQLYVCIFEHMCVFLSFNIHGHSAIK